MEELIPIVLFMSIAAVAIFRPLTSRFGKLLEAIAREKAAALKSPASEDADSARLRVLVEHLGRRLDLIEERLDFTERLISSSRTTAAPTLRAEGFRRDRETDLLTG